MKFNRFANNFRPQLRNSQLNTSGVANANDGQVPITRRDNSFEARQKVEKERQAIAKYKDSAVTQAYRQEAAKDLKAIHRERTDYFNSKREEIEELNKKPDYVKNTLAHQLKKRRILSNFQKTNPKSTNSKNQPKQTQRPSSFSPLQQPDFKPRFQEPPSRGYDPYK